MKRVFFLVAVLIISVWLSSCSSDGPLSTLSGRGTITNSAQPELGAGALMDTLATAIPIDIKPEGCPNPINMKSKGKLPVAILGTFDFDVYQIDPESILLAGVAPIKSRYDDVGTPFEPYVGREDEYDCHEAGPDSLTDMTLKFENEDIVAALGAVAQGDVLVLTLTGNLLPEFGGGSFMGEDVIIIKPDDGDGENEDSLME